MQIATIKKILNAALLFSSFIGYMQWGGNQHAFIFESEIAVLRKLFTSPIEALHPFTIIPLTGQLLLLYTLFQKEPSRWLTFIGAGFISILMLLILFIGLLAFKVSTILSTIPFLIMLAVAVIYYRKHPKQ